MRLLKNRAFLLFACLNMFHQKILSFQFYLFLFYFFVWFGQGIVDIGFQLVGNKVFLSGKHVYNLPSLAAALHALDVLWAVVCSACYSLVAEIEIGLCDDDIALVSVNELSYVTHESSD